jgi:hypothetical protein
MEGYFLCNATLRLKKQQQRREADGGYGSWMGKVAARMQFCQIPAWRSSKSDGRDCRQ